MRTASINRDTMETQIRLALELDGTGKAELDTGCGFLNHMLRLFARHGDFDLSVCCRGDTDVDDHHSVEDIGICLGQAFTQALGDKRGITRYGQFLLPMDETLVLCAATSPGGTIWAGRWSCPHQRSAPLTRGWPGNSGWPLCGTAPPPSTSARWRERIPTTFWRPYSRAWAGR